MTNPFIAEIRPMAFTFAPKGWALCDGQILSLSQNTSLFSLLGTIYGGDGMTTFALPNLQGRVPIHTDQFSGGTQYPIGATGGVETVTLLLSEMPSHNHSFAGTSAFANVKRPVTGSAFATSTTTGSSAGNSYYGPDATVAPLNSSTIAITGGSQPHSNLQPYLTISWCIALQGVFPPRS
jgi:microcystin-dependent protein